MPRPGVDGSERERIVAGAWTVLARSGFEGFKVQLVLREANLSVRSFYRHFSGKSELLLELLDREMARSAGLIVAAMRNVRDPQRRVDIWIRGIIGAAGTPERAARARMFTTQAPVVREFPDAFAAQVEVLLEPLVSALRDGLADGTFPATDVEGDARAILALAGGLMTSCLDDPLRYPLDEVTASATAFTLRALGARRAPAPPSQSAAASSARPAPR